MNLLPNTQITLRNGSIITLREIAALENNEYDNGITPVRDGNHIMYLQGDRGSRVLALIVGDYRLTVGEDSEILTVNGWKRAFKLQIGDKIKHRLPDPIKVKELRRVVGKILTYCVYTEKGSITITNGITIKTPNAIELLPTSIEALNAYKQAVEETSNDDH